MGNTKKTEQIAVISRVKGGFRRAGYKFNENPTLINVKDLTKDQLEQIKSEPNLVVVDSVADFETSADDKALKEANKKLVVAGEKNTNLEAELKETKAKLEATEKELEAAKKK